MAAAEVDIRLSLASAGSFAVARLTLDEKLSEGIVAHADIIASGDFVIEDAALRAATLTLAFDGVEVRRWSLVLASARFTGVDTDGGDGGGLRYRLELRDRLHPLALVTSTRKFRNLSVEAIVDRVTSEHGVTTSWQTTTPTAVRKWCAQYRETTRDFVLRLLEHEGIYFGFSPDGQLVLADESASSPHVSGPHALPLSEARGALVHEEPALLELTKGARVATGRATLGDYDWKRPRLSLLSSAAGDQDAELEVYDYPGGYRDPGEGARLAKMRLEARRVGADYLEGGSSAVYFDPGRRFSVSGAMEAYFPGDYFLTRVVHRAEVGALLPRGAAAEATAYTNTFEAIPARSPFRPPLTQRRPTVAGFHTAIVRGPAGAEIHTDRHGRFKAQFHWDREATGTDADSRWLRMLQETATSMTLARVGWEVSVGYIDGDPDRPIGMARNINGEMIPAYAQPAQKTVMAMKTPSSPASGGYSELKLDDTGGAMRFDLRAEKDLVGIVKHDREERVGNDELHVVGKDLLRTVERDQTIDIGGNASYAVNGNEQIVVEGNRTKTVGASERVEVGLARVETTEGDDKEKVGSLRMTIAGGVSPPSAAALKAKFIPSPKSLGAGAAMGAIKGALGGGGAAGAMAGAQGALSGALQPPNLSSIASTFLQGSITRTTGTGMLRMVGGGWITVAIGDIGTQIKLAYAETVGGVKLTMVGKDMGEEAGLGLATTVGGAILRTAADDMTIASQLTKVQVGALAHFDSKKAMTIKATSVTMTAAAEISLRAGALSITMSPGGVKLAGKLKLDGGSKITHKAGGTEDLTKA